MKYAAFGLALSTLLAWSAATSLAVETAPAAPAQGPSQPVDELSRFRAQADQSLAALDKFLSTLPPSQLASWKSFLKWDELQQELHRTPPDLVPLAAAMNRFKQNSPGLERRQFDAVQKALTNYLGICVALAHPELTSGHDSTERLNTLAAVLDKDHSLENRDSVARLAGYLTVTGSDSAGLAAEVRARHTRPNFLAQISARLVGDFMSNAVDKQSPVRDAMMGAMVTGTAHMRANLVAELRPSADRAAIDLHMRGNINAPWLTGRQQRVTVYSSSLTNVDAYQRLYIDDKGLHMGETNARCTTDTQYRNVVANSRIVENMAWRRLSGMQSQAEATASRRAEDRVENEMRQQAAKQVASANSAYGEKLLSPMQRLEIEPEKIALSTTAHHLRIAVKEFNPFQLGASADPQTLDPAHDLGVQFHESMLANIYESRLAGRVVSDREMLSFIKLLTGETPRPLWVHDNTPSWSLTMAAERPLYLKVGTNQLQVVWRSIGATRGDEVMNNPFEVSAEYDLVAMPEGPAMVRRGDLSVRVTNSKPSPGEDAEMIAFLLKKFDAVMQPKLTFEGLEPPAGGTWGKLRRMHLAEFTSAAGWITLAYQLPALPSSTNSRVAQRGR